MSIVYILIMMLYFFFSPQADCQSLSEPLKGVKISAVQISGYDKTVTPGLKVEAAENAVKYIYQAARDTAQLVVFPEYYLGRIKVPGEETKMISEAAAKNNIYVIIGSWEVIDDSTFLQCSTFI